MTTLINNYSLNYHKKRLKDFWKRWAHNGKHYRNIEWWISAMDLYPMKAGEEAKALVKDFIRIATLEKKISADEANRLWQFIKSKDKENQYIALSIIQGYYPHAFVKNNPKLPYYELQKRNEQSKI